MLPHPSPSPWAALTEPRSATARNRTEVTTGTTLSCDLIFAFKTLLLLVEEVLPWYKLHVIDTRSTTGLLESSRRNLVHDCGSTRGRSLHTIVVECTHPLWLNCLGINC
jgi:hypothetical protein